MRLEKLSPLALEHEAWQAIMVGQGAEFYARIMTKDARIFLPHAVLARPSASLEQWTRSLSCTAFRFLSERVVEVTESITYVAYEISTGPAEQSSYLRCSTLYVRQAPGWQLTLHQRWSMDPICA